MCTLCKQDKIPIPHGNEWKGSFLKAKGLALPSGYGSKAFLPNYSFWVLGAWSQLTVSSEIQIHQWSCKIYVCLWICDYVPDNTYGMHLSPMWMSDQEKNVHRNIGNKVWKFAFWKLRIFFGIYINLKINLY